MGCFSQVYQLDKCTELSDITIRVGCFSQVYQLDKCTELSDITIRVGCLKVIIVVFLRMQMTTELTE